MDIRALLKQGSSLEELEQSLLDLDLSLIHISAEQTAGLPGKQNNRWPAVDRHSVFGLWPKAHRV